MSEVRNPERTKRKWRKKPKTVLSNARKYAKKGQFGRGTRLPDEIYQYFVGILDVLKRGVDSEEDRAILVTNVLERTKKDEIVIIENQLGSYVIETLLPYSSEEDFERYMELIFPELRRLCCDNFSSHTVEKIVSVAAERAAGLVEEQYDEETPKKKKTKLESKYSAKHMETCKQFTLNISKYLLNNMEDFIWDSYANHILRSAIRGLAGLTYIPREKVKTNGIKITEKDGKKDNKNTIRDEVEYRAVPDDFKSVLKDFGERLVQWPQFTEMPFKNLTSGILQILLIALNTVDKKLVSAMIKKIVDESFVSAKVCDDKKEIKEDIQEIKQGKQDGKQESQEIKQGKQDGKQDSQEIKLENKEKEQESEEIASNMHLPPVFRSEPAVRLLEAALLVAKKKSYTQIYAQCFINRLPALVTMNMVHFSVQRLIDRCRVKEEFEAIFDELADHFSAIMVSNNMGVLTAIAKACLRLQARQTQFVTSLEKALKCKESPKYFVVACLRLLPLDKFDTSKLTASYNMEIHGSVILQTILEFSRPTKAVNSLLELSPEEVLVILKDAKGSRIADSFFAGQFVGAKSREKMFWKLKGNYQHLISTQFGSRAFDAIFESCTLEQKVKIMEEITPKCQLLNSTQWGQIVAAKLNIPLFQKSRERWQAGLDKKNKKAELFSDIVEKDDN